MAGGGRCHTDVVQEPLRFAVLGDPIDHSRSPAIHTAALDHLGLPGSYVAIRAGSGELRAAVEQLREGSFDGFNITMPLKEEAAGLAESLTTEAKRSGSVNTLRARNQVIEGHSSDVIATARALGDPRFDSRAPILVLGAGGAAAALLAGAATRDIYLAARNEGRARALVERIGIDAGVVPFGAGVTGAVVINATPLGMNGEILPERVLGVASGIIDLAYGQNETPTVARAAAKGLPLMDGVEFLVLQAAASFEWWLGRPAPIEVMVAAARNA
jgi:shikimate dehydrogenase